VPKVPAEVKAMIDSMSSAPEELSKDMVAEKVWDASRVKSCAECLQMAVEMLLILLPEGSLRDKVSDVSVAVATYKRRFTFVVAKVLWPLHLFLFVSNLVVAPVASPRRRKKRPRRSRRLRAGLLLRPRQLPNLRRKEELP
jgi:hypothetical protein